MNNSIRLLIADDSLFIRISIPRLLQQEKDIVVVGTAANGKEAVNLVKELKPDVVTLDVIMPEMNGLEALKEIMRIRPTSVVMLSAVTRRGAKATIEALTSGAIDFIAKPSGKVDPSTIGQIRDQLVQKIRMAAKCHPRLLGASQTASSFSVAKLAANLPLKFSPQKLIGIGASTGGPPALQSIVSRLPNHFPVSLVLVQHIASGFDQALVEELNAVSKMKVLLAQNSQPIRKGEIIVCPADKHLTIKNVNRQLTVKLLSQPQSLYTPSIDIFFKSLAKSCGPNAYGVVLTGMGDDGAVGLKAIKDKGGITIAQDEDSSLVYGMAKKAVEMGAVQTILPLSEIPTALLKFVSRSFGDDDRFLEIVS
jgi:two-component system chemotaxis response regulator CheB